MRKTYRRKIFYTITIYIYNAYILMHDQIQFNLFIQFDIILKNSK